ncbi:MAG: AAA family ATPase [Alphaproteobacteria bacterium]
MTRSAHDRPGRTSEQAEVAAFLASPATHGVRRVKRIDTHISTVFLAGDRAYKLKRAVRFDFVDFSTVERRQKACEAEVRINRRTAPSLYLGVLPVTRDDGNLALGGRGRPVDWVVAMVRFDEATLFDRLAAAGRLNPELAEGLTDAVVRLHDKAPRRPDQGGLRGMQWVLAGNADGLRLQAGEVVGAEDVDRYLRQAEAALRRHGSLLEKRREEGFVRACHGDLHLGNICLVDGCPTLFDAIEFNDAVSCCDVLYDLAFLIMDFLHRGLDELANLVFNRYLAATGDVAGLPPFGLFLSCRAAVRGKTSAMSAARQRKADAARAFRQEARRYLKQAVAFLEPPPPRLVAIGGLTGSGKSTLAARLAPRLGAPPGALVLRSDVIRKRLFGKGPCERLGAEAYTSAVTRRVYAALGEAAAEGLRAGQSVIADAVFGRPGERESIARIARKAGTPLTSFWLEAPDEVLARRVRARMADASDATEAVLRQQLTYPVGDLDWQRLDASGSPEATQRQAEAVLAR